MAQSQSIPYDPNPGLRAELLAELQVLGHEIRGLKGFLVFPDGSQELDNDITPAIVFRDHRRRLIQTILDALDAVVVGLNGLYADGYPDKPKIKLPKRLFDEINQEESDLGIAFKLFTTDPDVSGLNIEFQSPVPKE